MQRRDVFTLERLRNSKTLFWMGVAAAVFALALVPLWLFTPGLLVGFPLGRSL